MSEPIRVLVVDDEDRFRTTLVKLLGAQGFHAEAAPDGVQALALLSGKPFDVVLLDVKMPGLSGQEVLPRIKEIAPDVEVLILTGHASVDIAAQMIAGGAADYLLKPCPLDELVGCVRAVYDRRKAVGPR
ncbi:response regulator [Desulfolutivibrio sulfoxidireducens]|uniref:response regulator n=1 Tax=Desulfolutivibrio sulfoxidireducens TaxID=2773299 RepID=UPI00159D41C3|nr:response regulator [Desulfolutivibrio sulfoxidireducens]QLA17592.1 response regulator [Desulfolutivibrio sulfoxidireducens]